MHGQHHNPRLPPNLRPLAAPPCVSQRKLEGGALELGRRWMRCEDDWLVEEDRGGRMRAERGGIDEVGRVTW